MTMLLTSALFNLIVSVFNFWVFSWSESGLRWVNFGCGWVSLALALFLLTHAAE